MSERTIYYAMILPDLRDAAKECGYTLALHGSMARDLDLIAVPWTEDAASREALLEAVAGACGAIMDGVEEDAEDKPHGRRSYALVIFGEWYIDLSIMPRMNDQDKPA